MGGDPTEQQRRVLMTGLAAIACVIAVHGGRAATAVADMQAAVRLAPAYALPRW